MSLTDTRRGGRAIVSEPLSIRIRQSALNETPSKWQRYTLITPPCATTRTSSPFRWSAPIRSIACRTRAQTSGSGSPPGGGQSSGDRTHARYGLPSRARISSTVQPSHSPSESSRSSGMGTSGIPVPASAISAVSRARRIGLTYATATR